MRAAAFSVLSPLGAVIALSMLFAPHHALAAATFTRDMSTPFVSSVALKVGNNFIPISAKTNQDISVIISVDPGTLPANNVHYTHVGGGDSHLFTDNGQFTFTFYDDYGNTGSSTVTIDNIDRAPPTISTTTSVAGWTNGDVTITATTSDGWFTDGVGTTTTISHTFTENSSGYDFVATDEAGNISTSTVMVTNIDKTPPTITLLGVTAMRVKLNTVFSEPGFVAVDDIDLNPGTQATGTVDTANLGTYSLVYSATDSAGNIATTSRTVEVYRSGSGSSGGGGGSSRVLSVATVGQVLGAATYNFTRDLSYKQKGADVTALQEILIREGFLSEQPTGYFGTLTKKALMAYQKSHSISQTGVLGPVTRAVLSQAIATSPLSNSTQITLLLSKLAELQARLAALRG
ncbi:DUF5011 domain-containing protein [Patescibacteria group bacterium]|nr:DUF5011 domain-containing protein [Patescibacteria group bacterium]